MIIGFLGFLVVWIMSNFIFSLLKYYIYIYINVGQVNVLPIYTHR